MFSRIARPSASLARCLSTTSQVNKKKQTKNTFTRNGEDEKRRVLGYERHLCGGES